MDTVDWNEYADGWDDNDAVRAYASAAFGSLERLCDRTGVSLDGARVLDFGCGTGLLAEKLASLARSVLAVDSSAAMISVLQQKVTRSSLSNIHPLQCVVSRSLVKTHELFQEEFDLVVCSSVCGFLDDYPDTVSMLAARLRPGGLFVQWDWELDPDAHDDDNDDDDGPSGLTRDAIRSALSEARLEIVQVDTGFEIMVDGERMAPLIGVGQRPAAPAPEATGAE